VRNFGRRLGRRANRRYYSGLGRDDKSVCSKTSDAPSIAHDYENQLVDSPQKVRLEEGSIGTGIGIGAGTGTGIGIGSDGYTKSIGVHDDDRLFLPGTVDDVSGAHPSVVSPALPMKQKRTGFVKALMDSAIPNDVMDNTVGIARGDFHVEKKTLLYHAAASDEYSLFAKRRKAMEGKKSLTKDP